MSVIGNILWFIFAGFWQGVSRIVGQNLKSQYDKDNEDKMIEQIVIYYEAGLLR